jgi:2-desacetyl-2-hydroxyethyl bacteriochlorophyllide A dehydrogenase
MHAVKFYGVGDVRFEETEKPVPTPGQALVKILYGGICGSDLHIYREGMFVAKLRETMGHEFIGRVEDAPADCGFEEGDLVVGDPRVPCGRCVACGLGDYHRCADLGFIGEVAPGGFAEYLAISHNKLIKLKPETDPVKGALTEPLAVAVHACRRIAKSGFKNALVIGAGPIGLLIACLLKKQYAFERVAVSDIDAFRTEKAREIGADVIARTADEAAGQYDCVVDAAGMETTLAAALRAMRPGGFLFVSAIYEKLPVTDVNLIVGGELTVVGSNNYTFDEMLEAARIIESGEIDLSWLVTRILPASDAGEAFKLLTNKTKQDLKILLKF